MPRHSTAEEENDLILRFTAAMRFALLINRDNKSHWESENEDDLLSALEVNLEILTSEISFQPDRTEVRKRCVNIANFAAMIADRYKE